MGRLICTQCEKRPARRFCPGLREDICAPCCGAERENSIDCPFDCEYLREARRHEKQIEVDSAALPNADIRITETFLEQQEPLVMACGSFLFQAAAETPGAIDLDIREALDALIRTHRTLESGLVYETRPNNPLAASIQVRFQENLRKFREDVARHTGVHSVRDRDILGILVFWQRMELQWNNGRRRSRAFFDSLAPMAPGPAESPRIAP